MHQASVHVSGAPRFSEADLAQLAGANGPAAAWDAAFRRHGAAAAAQVQDSFAIGLKLDDGRSFLAVDRFAIETLCYRVVDGQLRWAAGADELADASTPLDPQALYDYLYFHVIPSPRTIYRGIFRLPPGHCAVFRGGQLVVAPYWQPRFAEDSAGMASFGALKDEFRALLQQGAARLLDGSKPACFLSGGTDSSTVAGMVGLAAGRPAASYSIGFEAQGYDEMAYARIAARHFGTEHHEYYVTPEDLVRSIPDVAAFYDQPFGNSSAVPAYYCARMARDDGVTKILAGDGGDELFGGNSRYAKQKVFGVWDDLPGALKPPLRGLFGAPGVRSLPLLRKVDSYIRQAGVPMPDRQQTYNLLERLGVSDVLSPAFLAQVDTGAPAAQQRAVWASTQGAGLLNRQLAFDWRYTLAENDLRKVCGTTQMAGVGVGFPMLDQQLLDFSLRLPPGYKLKGLKLRWFFKEALRGFLPDEILVKKKQGFGLPFGVWAVAHAPLNKLARDSLGSLSTRGMVQPKFIARLLDEHLPAHPHYYGEMVWVLMMLEQWLQAHAPAFAVNA